MSNSCAISRTHSFDGQQSVRIHSVEPSPAARPRRHRGPISGLRSAMELDAGADDCGPSPSSLLAISAGVDGEFESLGTSGRVLLSISSAPESSYPRRSLRPDPRAHETGFFDATSSSSPPPCQPSCTVRQTDIAYIEQSIADENDEAAIRNATTRRHSQPAPSLQLETETAAAAAAAEYRMTTCTGGHDAEADLDLLLTYKLSEPAPSQEVSVLSWTLSADTPADELMGLMDNDDQPTWVPSLEGDSTGRRTPEPPPPNGKVEHLSPQMRSAAAGGGGGGGNVATPNPIHGPSKEAPAQWETPSADSATAMVMFPFLNNSSMSSSSPPPAASASKSCCFDKSSFLGKASDSSPRTPADETFAWLQVCLNYHGPGAESGILASKGEGGACMDDDAIPDEFSRDHEFISLPLQIDRRTPKDRDFSHIKESSRCADDQHSPQQHDMMKEAWHPSTVATTTSLDLTGVPPIGGVGVGGGPLSPAFKTVRAAAVDEMTTDMLSSKIETPSPPPPPPTAVIVDNSVSSGGSGSRPRLHSCEGSSSDNRRSGGLALFSRPPMSARLQQEASLSRRGRKKSQTPRSHKTSRSARRRDSKLEEPSSALGGDHSSRHAANVLRAAAIDDRIVAAKDREDRDTKHLLFELLRRLDETTEAAKRAKYHSTVDDEPPPTSGELHRASLYGARSLRYSRRPRLATVAGRFYRGAPMYDEHCCDRQHEGCTVDDNSESEVEGLIRGICQEADAQVSAALEERDAILRESAAEHQRFVRALNKLEVSLQEKELENLRLTSEAAEERRRLRSKCEQLEEALEKWERSFDRLKSHASEREAQLSSDLKQAKESGMSKDSEIAKLNAEIIRRAHEFTSLQKQLHETREFDQKEVAELKRNHEDTLRMIRKKHEEEMSVLDQHWTTVVSNLNQMIADVKEKSDSKIAELQEIIEKQNAELAAMRAASSGDKKRVQTIENEWREKVKEKESEINKLRDDCEELASSLHKLKKAHDQLKKRNVSQEDYLILKAKNDESLEIINDLKNVLTSANDEKEELKAQANRSAARVQQLEKTLMEKEVAITIKGKMIEEQSLYMSKMREKLQSYEEEIIDLKSQKKRHQEELQKAVEEDRQNRVPDNPAPQFELRAENENLKRDLQEKVACLDLVAREIEELRVARNEERQKLIDDLEQCKLKLSSSEEELNSIKADMAKKESEIDNLTVELERVRSLATDKLAAIAMELAGGGGKSK